MADFNPADYPKNCHAGALALVRSKGEGWRVARGYAKDVFGQHSWAVEGNPYAPKAILDPTIWSYTDREPEIITGKVADYLPHGAGLIWDVGKPVTGKGSIISLKVNDRFAQSFLDDLVGPLDRKGWSGLANGPMQGWPAKPVIEAMLDHPELAALVPIDIAGMVTDRNPDGLYW